MADPSGRRFNEDEVEAILRDAVDRQAHRKPGALDRADLHELARQIGIDPANIDAAIADHDRRQETDRDLADARERLRRGFRAHFTAFALVNVFLFLLNAVLPGPWWFMFPLFGWGLGLAFHGLRVRRGPSERDVERQRRRRERAAERARRRETREAIRRDARAIGHAVEDGVREVLGGVRKVLDEGPGAARGGARVDVGTEPPRSGVRVEAATEEPGAEGVEVERGAQRGERARR